jgi:hypothetical protein
MKTRIVLSFIIAAGLGASLLSSCHIGCIKGSHNQITDKRQIGNFEKIDVSGGFVINMKQDSSNTLTVTADDNVMKYIRTEVSGTKLRIFTRKDICGDKPIAIDLGVKNLKEIKGSGAVELVSEGRVAVQDLKLELSGASKVDMDLNAANIKTKASGATEINLKGQATSHDLHVSGAGKIFATDLVVGSYKIETSGAVNCKINVLKSLITNTSGASEIQYKGNPETIKTHKSGASEIKHID